MNTLLELHDFELALVEPLMAMTDRGVLIDDERRLQLIAELAAEIEPMSKELNGIALPLIEANETKLKRARVWHLFQEKWTCPCCRNGKKKKVECWGCAGYSEKPSAKKLREDVATKGKQYFLDPCEVCGGEGQRITLHYNHRADKQKAAVLYTLLRLPKRTKTVKKNGKKVRVVTVDASALKTLLVFDKTDFVKTSLRIAKHETMTDIYERMAPGPDGRLRTMMNPAGTETGRLNHAETFLEP